MNKQGIVGRKSNKYCMHKYDNDSLPATKAVDKGNRGLEQPYTCV